jgi:hypothetical protein
MTTRRGDPCYTHALTGLYGLRRLQTLESFDDPHYLVPQHRRQPLWRSPPFDLVQLRVANPTPRDAQQYFSFTDNRFWRLHERKRSVLL